MSVLDSVHFSGRRTERLVRILELLGNEGSVPVSTLCEELGVSQATMRRDLTVLESQSLLTRTHGAAMTPDSADEFPVRYRAGYHHNAKKRIAAACAHAIPRSTHIVAIAGGTTTSEVARLLADRRDLTVVTNALNIALECAHRPHARLIVTGGQVRAESLEMVGQWTEQFLDTTLIGTVIMGVNGISAAGGLTTHDPVEARANAHMVQRGRRVIVVADASKIGVAAPAQMADVTHVNLLITNKDAPDAEVQALRDAGVEVWTV